MVRGKKTPPAPPPEPEGAKARNMGLYRIVYSYNEGEERYAWAGTQADAKAKAKELGGTWAKYDVPVDKAHLLAFLNENVTGKEEPDEE